MASNASFNAISARTANSRDKSLSPLAGVVLCCTSIPPEERSELASIAGQMGAITKLDLTSDVTHLIIGELDTPKYKYVAKERPDIKCLQPQWVHALREVWMDGAELDIADFEEKYKLPTFFGLRICITGFEDLTLRKQIEATVNANGAEYLGDLSKDITHLIAHSPTGAKYKHGKMWGIKIVTIEWLEQSLKRGMVLDESLYDPVMDPVERGKGAWNRSLSETSFGKRKRLDESLATHGRKLRRSASSKHDSQNDGFWSDITMAAQQAKAAAPQLEDVKVEYSVSAELNSIRSERDLNQEVQEEQMPPAIPKPKGIFGGKQFYLRGFDSKQTPILEKCLSSHGAEILSTISQDTQESTLKRDAFVLVPHNLPSTELPNTQDSVSSNIFTDFWIEKCLYRKDFVEPGSQIIYTPFRFPISNFGELIVTSTAFEGIELLHLCKTIKLLGANYDEYLSAKVSVLVCNDGSLNREKVKAALEWRVPAVKVDWLWDSIAAGARLDFDKYLLYPKAQQRQNLQKFHEAKESKDKDTGNSSREKAISEGSRNQDQRRTEPQQPQPHTLRDDKDARDLPQREKLVNGPFAEDEDDSPPQDDKPRKELTSPMKLDPFFNRSAHSRPQPLKERSPNSPTPRPSISPAKSTTAASQPASSRQLYDRDALSDAISSLLAQHKAQGLPPTNPTDDSSIRRSLFNSTNTNITATDGRPSSSSNRRNRKLLGRAASNLSNRSGGGPLNINTGLSRTSSVGTLNTDDLGTPLEIPAPAVVPAPAVSTLAGNSAAPTGSGSLTTSALTSHDDLLLADEDEFDAEEEKPLQMTQVGYEDPEAGRWRAKLMRKVRKGVGGEADDDEGVQKEKEEDRTKDRLEDEGYAGSGLMAGGGGIGRRTRGRLGRV